MTIPASTSKRQLQAEIWAGRPCSLVTWQQGHQWAVWKPSSSHSSCIVPLCLAYSDLTMPVFSPPKNPPQSFTTTTISTLKNAKFLDYFTSTSTLMRRCDEVRVGMELLALMMSWLITYEQIGCIGSHMERQHIAHCWKHLKTVQVCTKKVTGKRRKLRSRVAHERQRIRTRLRIRPAGVESKKDIGARKMHRIIPRKYFWAMKTPPNETQIDRIAINNELAKDRQAYTKINLVLLIFGSSPSLMGDAHAIQ